MTAVPPELEEALYAAARAAVGDAPLATGALARAIVDRSERYTSDRAHLSSPADPDADLAARAVFFTPTDAMKVTLPLAELIRRGGLPARRPLRIADVGAGCGAMTLGALTMLDDAEIVAIDRDERALAIMRAAVGRPIETRVADVTKAAIPPCDLVLIGTTLNELAGEAALALVERALAAIADDGAVIVIEPALRTTTRALHAIRDSLITRGRGHIFAPCTRRIAPCTALADPDDWCHEDRPLALPPRTAELARLTHLRDSGMKFSYLVIRTQPLALADEGAWRIVSAPRISKGKLELIGCGERGRFPLRLLKRNRTADTKALERTERGDIVVATDEPDAERVEIRGPIEVTRERG